MFLKFLSNLPRGAQWQNSTILTQKQFIQQLVAKRSMIDLLLADLLCYKRKALALWQPNVKEAAPGVFCPATLDTYELFDEGYTHTKNIETRLTALVNMLSACEGTVKISAQQLSAACNILLTS